MARVGGPRVFFDVIGVFNATRMIEDQKAQMAVVESIVLDSVEAVTQSFAGIGATIDSLTQATVPLAMALSEATIEFEKFAGENDAVQQNIIETGRQFGFSADQALLAGARMAQLSSILGEGTTDIATELGQQFALISGMGTEEAMQRLINLQQQTSFMYGDLTQAQYRLMSVESQRQAIMLNTTEVLDQLNTIENRSASTMKQMTFVMNQFASQAHTTGESMAMMAAQSATLIEAGEEQGKAGRALRMVYARLGSNIQDNNDKLHALGVETHDATTGALRPLSEIVNDLSVAFEDMSLAEQQAIIQAVAGNDHYVRLGKLIQNVDRMNQLATDAIDDQATAQEELNRVLDAASTKYKAAQADLQLYQAELGDKMIPAMTKAVNLQARLYEAAGSFGGNMGIIVDQIFTGIIKVREFSRVFGGFFDTYLNLRSVNIAIETHRAVLKSLRGEQIVVTDNYRKQGIFSGITLENQKEIARTEYLLREQVMKRTQSENQYTATYKTRLDLQRLEKTIQEQLAANLVEQSTLNEKIIVGHSRMVAIGAVNNELNERSNNLLKGRVVLENMLSEKRRQLIQKRIQETDMANKQIFKEIRLLQIKSTYVKTDSNEIEKQINQHQRVIDKNNRKIQQGRILLEQDAMALILMEDRAAAEARINAMDDEYIVAAQQMGFLKQELIFLTDMEIEQLKELNGLRKVEGALSVESEKNTMKRMVTERMALDNGKANIKQAQTFNVALTRMSMAAGMASMALMMFPDSAESMRASLILMTLSMLPMVGQMMQMTMQTGLYAGAAGGAAVATTGLSAALNSIPGMLLVSAGLAAVAYALASIIPEAEDVTDSLYDMNAALDQTINLATLLSEQGELTTPEDMLPIVGEMDVLKASNLELEYLLHESNRILEGYQAKRATIADDDPMAAHYDKQIRDAEIYINSIEALQSANIGRQLFAFEGNDLALADEVLRQILVGGLDAPLEIPYGLEFVEEAKTGTRIREFRDEFGVPTFVQEDVFRPAITDLDVLIDRLGKGIVSMSDLTDEGVEFLTTYAQVYIDAADVIERQMASEGDSVGELADSFTEAEEKMRMFANAREELFFGGKSSYMTGDMMKQVVNKGVENLYSNVELLMTNNFYGLTFDEAVDSIASRVTRQLIESGVPLNNGGLSI